MRHLQERIGSRLGSMSPSLRGLAYMLCFSFVMSAMIACVRFLSADLPAVELAFFRVFFGLVVFLPVLLRSGVEPLRTQRFGLHALRAILHATSILMFFTGVSLTPIAKATSISFSAPLFATAIANGLLSCAGITPMSLGCLMLAFRCCTRFSLMIKVTLHRLALM